MGGELACYSEENVGSSFVFYVPTDSASSPEISRGEPLSASNTIRPKALVVDDLAYNRDVHKLILEKQGVDVDVAQDGKEAINKFFAASKNKPYDFIFMDIKMPVMDGITAAKEIRKLE